MELRAGGSGFRVWVGGFWAEGFRISSTGLGLGSHGCEFKVQHLGFKVQGLGFSVHGLGYRARRV